MVDSRKIHHIQTDTSVRRFRDLITEIKIKLKKIKMSNCALEQNMEKISLDEVIEARHKKERKELQSKIQALKKMAGKGDKKKKKEVLEEIARLEANLDQKHADELNHCSNAEPDANQNDIQTSATFDEKTVRISKAQKRREKKAAEEKIRQAEILAEQELHKDGPRSTENNAIKNILSKRGLTLQPISSDGNCLYNAVRHQLQITGRFAEDVSTLRSKCADYITANMESLICYMINPDTGNIYTDSEFEKYCSDLRNSPAWGGHIEIRALAHVLKVPIEVIQAVGPVTVQGDDKFSGPNLVITYHRHIYSLGEHYNSTKPIQPTESNDEDDD